MVSSHRKSPPLEVLTGLVKAEALSLYRAKNNSGPMARSSQRLIFQRATGNRERLVTGDTHGVTVGSARSFKKLADCPFVKFLDSLDDARS